jgi:hypothetical protein
MSPSHHPSPLDILAMAAAAAPTAEATEVKPDPVLEDESEDDAPKSAAKKKKKKPKKKKKAGGVPAEVVPVLAESAEETAAWEAQQARGKTYGLPPWLLNERVSGAERSEAWRIGRRRDVGGALRPGGPRP